MGFGRDVMVMLPWGSAGFYGVYGFNRVFKGLSGIFKGFHRMSGFNVMLKGFSGILNGFSSILKGLNGIWKGGGWKDFDGV